MNYRCSKFAAALFAAAFALAAPGPAAAQTKIVALVNNTPITSTEVAERKVVVRLTQKKQIGDKEALDQLINMNLLFQEANRLRVNVTDAEVEQRVNAIAANAKFSVDQLGKALSQSGASLRGFRMDIRSSLLQRRLMGLLSRKATGISEKEIAAGITAKKSEGDAAAYRYTMQQIVFVSPKGSSAAQVNQRKSEAESLRRRIKDCDQAAALAKELRDVAVKPPVTRLSAQLPNGFRDQLAGLKIGQSTKAEQNELGVEIIVICDKQETVDDSALRTEVQNELAMEQGKGEVDKFVADLRKRALIIYK